MKPCSKPWSTRTRGGPAPLIAPPSAPSARCVGGQRGLDRVLADVALELLPDGLHRLDPLLALLRGQLPDLNAGVRDLLAGLHVDLVRQVVVLLGDLREDP